MCLRPPGRRAPAVLAVGALLAALTLPAMPGLPARAADSTELAAQESARSAARDEAETALHAAALTAGEQLEKYSLAVRAQQEAAQAQQLAEAQLQLRASITRLQERKVGVWVRATYRQGLGVGADPTLAALLSGDGGPSPASLAVLRHVGQGQVTALAQLRLAQREQQRKADEAAAAGLAAAEAAVAASSAREAAQAAVARQRDLLGAADASLARTRQDLKRVRLQEGVATSPLTGGNTVSGPTGDCAGADVSAYPNGRIPAEALCPLGVAPNHRLRADAAYAFDRLAAAFTQNFGTAMCVTDSYRSYEQQVALFKAKPKLAARPGTSNHGWGTATDLCGGIQSFGTVQYDWMLDNAPLYGWFNPAWARQGSGREEPWHWEFGG